MAIYQTTIIGRKQVAKNTTEISFKRPSNFSFKAGQYIQFGVPKLLYPDHQGASRVLSIASSPIDEERISVTFRDTDSGFKRTLKDVPINSSVNIDGPYGFFTLPKNVSHGLVLIAGGIGITPYLSMIRFASKRGFTFPITLLYTNRDKESATYLEELQDISNSNERFTLKNKFGRINERFIQQNVKDIKQCIWHIAGPPAMVDYAKNTLFLLGVSSEQVYAEEFTGYE